MVDSGESMKLRQQLAIEAALAGRYAVDPTSNRNNRTSYRASLPSQPGASPSAPFDPTVPLFLYGSLMVPAILTDLLGILESDYKALLRPSSAILLKHKRYKIAGASFPAAVPTTDVATATPAGGVPGLLVYLRNAEDIQVLDDLERALFNRLEVEVDVHGTTQKAYAYVWHGEGAELTDEDWNYEEFVKTSLPSWLPVPSP